MALPILAYLGYAGAAAALGFLVSSCNSEEKKSESPNPTPSGSTTPPTPPKTKLEVDPKSPVYQLYEELKKSGLNDEKIDTVNRPPTQECDGRTSCLMEFGPPPYGVHLKIQSIGEDPAEKDGKITEYDLIKTSNYFFRKELSEEENKKWQDRFKTTFKEISDRYYQMGAQQSGTLPPTPPQACQGMANFQKSVFWNWPTARAHFILGICKSDPLHLFQAIQVNPEFQEAKIAVEEYYRKKNQKDPKDPLPWMNLGYALKAQGKLKEAVECYQEALKLNPKMPTAHLELREIFRKQGNFSAAKRHEKLALPKDCPARGFHSMLPYVREETLDSPPLGTTPQEKAKSFTRWMGPYDVDDKKQEEDFWDFCRETWPNFK